MHKKFKSSIKTFSGKPIEAQFSLQMSYYCSSNHIGLTVNQTGCGPWYPTSYTWFGTPPNDHSGQQDDVTIVPSIGIFQTQCFVPSSIIMYLTTAAGRTCASILI